MSVLFPDEPLDETKFKYCKKCDRNLPTFKFGKACGGNYLYSECKECSRKLSKIRKQIRKNNPLENPEEHVCPICNRSHKETIGDGGFKLKNPWVADHSHETGKFRGYICHSCNRGLGIFHDSEKTLLNAINYLKQHA